MKTVAVVISRLMNYKASNSSFWLINLSFKLITLLAIRLAYNSLENIFSITSRTKALAITPWAKAFIIISAPFKNATIFKMV